MDELFHKLVELRAQLVPFWNEARCTRTFRALCRLRRRRQLLRAVGSSLAVAAICGVLFLPHPWLGWGATGPVTASVAAAAREDWLGVARRGDHARAYELLAQGALVANDVDMLLEAAEVARRSAHPEAAVGYLKAVLRDHPAHPQTPMAAFDLGRELLEQLGRPVEAAEAFATAADLARDPSFEQDALAREVECWSKAGRAEEAYQRALDFRDRFPTSRRLKTVQLFGGLSAR